MITCVFSVALLALFQTPPAEPSATADRSNTPVATSSSPVTGFLRKTLTLDNETYAYCVYVPPDYTPDRKWPVILFLHGSGERGSDGFLQTEVGLPRAIRRDYRVVPAIVVMPQCRNDRFWVEPTGELGTMAQMALKCVEQTSREYNCDADRLYLTGLSLGGAGSWHIAATYPERFAAVVPVCGFTEKEGDAATVERVAARVKDLPVWVFHGDEDTAVPVARAREIVAAVRRAGGTKIHYTEYPGVNHNSWDKAYAEREMWQWLFAQHRGQ